MKIPLVGPTYQDRSLSLDAQRTVNLYPVLDESQGGKDVAALQGTPGLSLFATCGSGVIRGAFTSSNGRAFVVSGSSIYEVLSNGTSSSVGTLLTFSSTVTMDENPTQLAICDGTSLYIFTYATNAFVRVTASGLPAIASNVCFIDSYFVVASGGTGQFFISAVNDGTAWSALDFATAESSPDNLVRAVNAMGMLWLFGTRTVEIWINNGSTAFPFQRISSSAKMEVGCAAANSIVSVDNSLFWVSQDVRGNAVIYKATGFSPQRVSNFAVEYVLQQLSDLSVLRAYAYQENGHTFYVLTGTGLSSTWVFDISANMWHERAYLNSSGVYETHLSVCHMYAFGKHLVGDRQSGNVYNMSLSNYDDNGSPIKRQRTFTHVLNENKAVHAAQLQVDFESGVGTAAGSDPQCWLEISEDFARTWSPEYYTSIGKQGNYLSRAVWRRLGQAYKFTFRLSISDPVKVSITGAYLN